MKNFKNNGKRKNEKQVWHLTSLHSKCQKQQAENSAHYEEINKKIFVYEELLPIIIDNKNQFFEIELTRIFYSFNKVLVFDLQQIVKFDFPYMFEVC